MQKTTSNDHTTATTIRATSAQQAKESGGTADAKVSSDAAISNDKSHTTLLGNGTKVRGHHPSSGGLKDCELNSA